MQKSWTKAGLQTPRLRKSHWASYLGLMKPNRELVYRMYLYLFVDMCMKYMCESTYICVLEYIHGCVFVVYMSCLCLCV